MHWNRYAIKCYFTMWGFWYLSIPGFNWHLKRNFLLVIVPFQHFSFTKCLTIRRICSPVMNYSDSQSPYQWHLLHLIDPVLEFVSLWEVELSAWKKFAWNPTAYQNRDISHNFCFSSWPDVEHKKTGNFWSTLHNYATQFFLCWFSRCRECPVKNTAVPFSGYVRDAA